MIDRHVWSSKMITGAKTSNIDLPASFMEPFNWSGNRSMTQFTGCRFISSRRCWNLRAPIKQTFRRSSWTVQWCIWAFSFLHCRSRVVSGAFASNKIPQNLCFLDLPAGVKICSLLGMWRSSNSNFELRTLSADWKFDVLSALWSNANSWKNPCSTTDFIPYAQTARERRQTFFLKFNLSL